MEGDNEEGKKDVEEVGLQRASLRENIGWIIGVEALEEMLCHLGTDAYC